MKNSSATPDDLRREAKWRCHLCPGSGFTSLGYPSVGLLYLVANILAIVAWGAAVMTFARTAALIAGIMLLVVLLLYVIEIMAVSKARIRALAANRLRSAFIPIVIGQYALALVVVGMLFGTSGSLRMRGAGMSPALEPGDRLIYRKHAQPTDVAAGRLILFRLNPENTWIRQRVLVVARALAVPGEAKGGEGVLGLRRAFVQAGAANLLVTLWQVNDEATSTLMTSFYSRYLSGTPAWKSLLEAQREFLRKQRAAGLEPHPQLWAAFVASGIGLQ